MLYRIAIMIDSLLGIFHISHLFRQHQGFLFHGLDLGYYYYYYYYYYLLLLLLLLLFFIIIIIITIIIIIILFLHSKLRMFVLLVVLLDIKSLPVTSGI